MKIAEGYIPFKEYQTYYRLLGELNDTTIPLVICHGGPGSSHYKLRNLDELSLNRPVIMYDQIGCANSPCSNTMYFNKETWCEELNNLLEFFNIQKCHLLGHSWGGMLIQEFYFNFHPEKVASLILSSTLPSSALWAKEQQKWISLMSEEEQEILRTTDYHSEKYQKALDKYMLQHCFPKFEEDAPDYMFTPSNGGLAYITGWGENEFTPTGNLKDFNHIEDLKRISVPTLILSGFYDLSTSNINKMMNELIPNSKWVLFENSRHIAYYEERELYIQTVNDFLSSI